MSGTQVGLTALAATFGKASEQIHQRSQDKLHDNARTVEADANAGSDQLGANAVTTYGSGSATVSTVQPALNQTQGGVGDLGVDAVAAGQRLGRDLATLGAQLIAGTS